MQSDPSGSNLLEVAVDLPAYSRLTSLLSYQGCVPRGTLVRVPLGKKQVLGIVWSEHEHQEGQSTYEIKPIDEVFEELAPLNGYWRDLVAFTAEYYQRSLGEVALQALPPDLRKMDRLKLKRRLARLDKQVIHRDQKKGEIIPEIPVLTPEQNAALGQICNAFTLLSESDCHANKFPAAFLLKGATGSGKTEVYLRATHYVLEKALFQVLVLVPEINLTPQLEERYRARFPDEEIVTIHSGMTNAQRLRSWLLAHTGRARVILGTRMAIFSSLPHLKLIIVDEEHDPSYKQYEGARWSARDLAVWRGTRERIPVILGSATPSLESCLHVKRKTYKLLDMPSRIGAGMMPKVQLVDLQHAGRGTLLAPALVDAIQERVSRGEQSLVLLNRRGYAPILYCPSCGWKSQCPNCSAYRVFHRVDRSLRCHHCSFSQPVPKRCPDCGDVDLQPIGKGTESLEEQLQKVLVRPDGEGAHVLRIDADSTRLAGMLSQHLQQAHEGDVDVLVGTQMIAKGHDFRRVTLVAAVNPDTALFSSDFRAGERLFSLLMQAAGRAGRDEALAQSSEFWVQTIQPLHPLYQALKTYDFNAFVLSTLEERESAAMPPYSYLSLIRAEGRKQEDVQTFLNEAHGQGLVLLEELGVAELVILYPAIPAVMQRVAGMERAQMLIESSSRKALQVFLRCWQEKIHELAAQGVVRWVIDVDPQSI